MHFLRTFLRQPLHSSTLCLQRSLSLSFPQQDRGLAVGDGSEEEPKESLSSRLEKMGESVGAVVRGWMGEGFPIHRGDVFHAVQRFRKRNMNKRALEFVEWLIRERPYKPKELEYSYLLEFTTKLHGIASGEGLFKRIPVEFQNELLYNNLVIACLDKGVIRLSLAYMKKMRELSLPISPYIYNRLIILHSSPARRKMIPKIRTQMKADRVAHHTSTYNILLKIEADDHNIEGLMKIFGDMKRLKVEPNEITYCILATAHVMARLYAASEAYVESIEKLKTGKNWSTFEILINLYGYLAKEEELERTWKMMQGLPYVRSQSFLLAIEAFGRTGRVDKSEELWNEMGSKWEIKFTNQFNSIITVYSRCGLLDKASQLYNEMERKGCPPNAITYRNLAVACLKAGLVEEALKTLEVGKDQPVSFRVKRSMPWLEVTYSLIHMFADVGDLETVKKLFEEVEVTRYCRHVFVHNALLKAHINARVYDPSLLEKMILAGARPDAETYSLIRVMEQFKT